ncbi:unnamed protein product [Lota lota]
MVSSSFVLVRRRAGCESHRRALLALPLALEMKGCERLPLPVPHSLSGCLDIDPSNSPSLCFPLVASLQKLQSMAFSGVESVWWVD